MADGPSKSKSFQNQGDLENAWRNGNTDNSEQRKHGWSPEKHPENIVLSEDSLVAKRGPDRRMMQAVRGKVEYNSGVHAFEISWKLSARSHMCIGIVSPEMKLSGNSLVLGADDQSVGWDIVSKEIIFNGVAEKKFPTKKDDVVPETLLLILNMEEGFLAFQSKNQDFGVAFTGLKRVGRSFHVAAALGSPGDQVTLKYVGSIDGVKVEHKEVSQLKFSTMCGSNIILSENNTKAERKRPLELCDHATVLTNRPLKIGELFQVKVGKIVRGKWKCCFKIGATSLQPKNFKNLKHMGDCHSDTVWTFTSNRILKNTDQIDELNGDLEYAKVGETVGLKLQRKTIEFYMDGYKQTAVTLGSSESLYGYVDVYGNTSAVSLIVPDVEDDTGDIIQRSKVDNGMPANMNDYLQMLETGLTLMKAENADYISDVYQILKCLNRIQTKSLTERQKREAGDAMANDDGAKIMAAFMLLLRKSFQLHSDAVQCYPLLKEVCFNFSEHSMLLCKTIAQTALFEFCIGDMVKFVGNYQESEKAGRILKADLGILQNCARVPENKPMFKHYKYMDIAKEYLVPECNPTWACMQTLFTMSYVHDDSDINLLVISTKVLDTMSKCLRHGMKATGVHEFGGWTVSELVLAMTNLTANSENVAVFINHGFLEHLITILTKGNNYEKECALNAVWHLLVDKYKATLAMNTDLQDILYTLIEDTNVDVKQAAIRVQVKLQAGNMLLTVGLPLNSSVSCDYMEACARFVETLGLSEFFFSKEYDVCYCAVCHGKREGKLKYIRGNPPKGYGVPIGWCRFGLSPPPKAKALDVFSNWHRAYHGTKKDYIKGILEVGELVPAGRDVIGGGKVREQDGHFNDWRKPLGFDTKQVFLSPSIRYSSCSAYAKPSRFFDQKTKKTRVAKVVLQVLIKPDCYTVGPETIGAREGFDPCFSNQELEWSTKQQGSIVLYGLLVNLS